MNIFDGIRDAAVAVVNNTMGYTATWTPKAGGLTQTAKVLYKDASEVFEHIENDNFQGTNWAIEYLLPNFEQLANSVGGKELEEISIDLTTRAQGTKVFTVQHVVAKWDGKTMIAYLLEKP